MESLYACRFSNGHIKVGWTTIDAEQRIAQHVARVACFGVTLIDQFFMEVPSHGLTREGLLIERCAEHATDRFQREWFTGLDFPAVCSWLREAAAAQVSYAEGFGPNLREQRLALGLTQTELGRGLDNGQDVPKATISRWESGTHEPSLSLLRALCQRMGCSADLLLGA